MTILAVIFGIWSALVGASIDGATTYRTYTVLPTQSSLYVVTHRAGLLSFLGHEHAIIPMSWAAELCLSEPMDAGSHGALVIGTRSLVVDTDSARGLAGLGAGPGRADRFEIQQKLHDPAHLDTAAFPEILIDVIALGPAGDDEVPVTVTLTLRGVSRTAPLRVGIEHGDSGKVTLSGVLRVRQRDFGMRPESVAGVVKVANDVDLHFRLAAVPAADPCEPGPR